MRSSKNGLVVWRYMLLLLIVKNKPSILQRKKIIQENDFDIHAFNELVLKIKKSTKNIRSKEIKRLISFRGIIEHYKDSQTKRKILSSSAVFDYEHELYTAIKLTEYNYDVLFTPKGLFKRNQKKFDVFILRDHVLFEADLKCIHSINPDTIGNRIKEGSEQAARIVLDICSAINTKSLITGLKTGCERNNSLLEILLFYNGQFFCLPKNKILSKKIFEVIK